MDKLRELVEFLAAIATIYSVVRTKQSPRNKSRSSTEVVRSLEVKRDKAGRFASLQWKSIKRSGNNRR